MWKFKHGSIDCYKGIEKVCMSYSPTFNYALPLIIASEHLLYVHARRPFF
jgi:hypothetical protein